MIAEHHDCAVIHLSSIWSIKWCDCIICSLCMCHWSDQTLYDISQRMKSLIQHTECRMNSIAFCETVQECC